MKRSVHFIMLIASLSPMACDHKPSTADGPKEAIVDGRIDVAGVYPHVVLVGQGCTGTLVSPVHVLTAAHCVCESQATADGGWVKDPSYCQNAIEISFESTPESPQGQVNGIVSVHPMFFLEANARNVITSGVADLAVITLNDCAPKSVRPVPVMESAARLPSNGVALGRIVGFGKTSCDAESRAVDRWWGDAFVTTVGTEFLEISSTVNLAGTEFDGAVSWSGDSGGPLLMDQDVGEWRVSGVLSKATCGQSGGDTAWYTNIHAYRDWYNAVVDPAQGEACNQPELEFDPPLLTEYVVSFDVETTELVVVAEIQDRSEQGLSVAELRFAALEGTECGMALQNAPIAASLVPPEGATEVWSFAHRITTDLVEGEVLCVELTAGDFGGGISPPSIIRVTRCEDDCHGNGQCNWGRGVCECNEQWSGGACDVCTPSCDGLSCGNDGCGGICGVCDAPPAPTCSVGHSNGNTANGLPIFGVDARTGLSTYPAEGNCGEGACSYESSVKACPDVLGYQNDAQMDYGCLDGRCLDRCELIDHPVFDFLEIQAGVEAPPLGYDRAYVSGVPTDILFFCPEAVHCSGAMNHTGPNGGGVDAGLEFTCDGEISVEMTGQVWAQCPRGERLYPDSLQVMVICVARDTDAPDGVNQLPYLCPEAGMNYSPNSGYYNLDCNPPFPVEMCSGRIDIHVRGEFLGREGAYIAKINDFNAAQQCP